MVLVQPVPKQLLLDIEVIAVLCLDMVDFSFNLAVEKVQFLQKTVIWDFK